MAEAKHTPNFTLPLRLVPGQGVSFVYDADDAPIAEFFTDQHVANALKFIRSVSANDDLVKALTAHQTFFAKLVTHFFGDVSLDLEGCYFQDWATECGLLKEEPYDPEKHGPNESDAEPGDPWYAPTNIGKDALAKAESPPDPATAT